MSNRLYYTNSFLTSFDATVVAATANADVTEVVLDRTAFYPTSGGQPFDTGRLAGLKVREVIDREADGAVVHVVEGALAAGAAVHGDVDWPRRFDHMQQHTGQHVLSAAFDRVARAATVSFHLGSDVSTIDLSREVSASEITEAEAAANDIVWQDRDVTVRFVNEDEARKLPLRKESARTGELRIVEVSGFDTSACGGTHVTRTGQIGVIAITGWERFKGGSRIGFACGGRALRAHARLRDIVAAAMKVASVGAGEVPATIERLQGDLKTLSRDVKTRDEELARYRAADWRASAPIRGAVRLVLQEVPHADGGLLKTLAAAVVAEPGVVVVLAGGGTPVPTVVARSADVTFDAGAWMKKAIERLGGRGGGRPEMAQGGLGATAREVLALADETVQ